MFLLHCALYIRVSSARIFATEAEFTQNAVQVMIDLLKNLLRRFSFKSLIWRPHSSRQRVWLLLSIGVIVFGRF